MGQKAFLNLGRRRKVGIQSILFVQKLLIQLFELFFGGRIFKNQLLKEIVKEIAKMQKCSINTCLARMQYALGKLRSILKDEYEELQEAMS